MARQHELFITELPFRVVNKIHTTLDIDQAWKKLADVLGYSFQETELFAQAAHRPGGSPTRDLLLNWSHRNPTVSDLYRHLVANKLNHAAAHLKDYVGPLQQPGDHAQRPLQPQLYPVPGGFPGSAQHGRSAVQPPPPGVARPGHIVYQRQGFPIQIPGFPNQSRGIVLPGQDPASQGPGFRPPGPWSTPPGPGCPPGSIGNQATWPAGSHGPAATASHGPSMLNVIPVSVPPPPVPPPDDAPDGGVPREPRQQGLQPHTGPVQHQHSYNTLMQNQLQNLPRKPDLGKFDSDKYMTTIRESGPGVPGSGLSGDGIPYRHPNQFGSGPDSSFPLTTTSSIDNEPSLLSTLSMSFEHLQKATGNFDEKNLLGGGGFGRVYKGEIAKTVMAIKVLKDRETFKDAEEKFRHQVAEIRALNRFRHPNIIILSGYSVKGPQLCLVYEYMKNGSLEDHLVCKGTERPLHWPLRYRILLDAARGLNYLHSAEERPYIHGDIKSANILLDEFMKAKIADFNLAKEATGGTLTGEYTHITKQEMAVYGSKAYLPRDFFANDAQFSTKSDVYSFGVVVYEVCVGRKAWKDSVFLRDEIDHVLSTGDEAAVLKLKDRRLPDWPDNLWRDLFDLGTQCASSKKKKRPTMEQVHNRLEKLQIEVQIWLNARTDVNRNSLPQGDEVGSAAGHGPRSSSRPPVPREQSGPLNEGPSLLAMLQHAAQNGSLASNDPRLAQFDAPKKEPAYALQDRHNVSAFPSTQSHDSHATTDNNPSGSSRFAAARHATEKFASDPAAPGRDRAAELHAPVYERGRSEPNARDAEPNQALFTHIPSQGSGLTAFYNGEAFQLQHYYDSQSSMDPASLAAQPQGLQQQQQQQQKHFQQLQQQQQWRESDSLQGQPQGLRSTLSSYGYENAASFEPPSLCSDKTSLDVHTDSIKTISSSTEELHNEANEELERSLNEQLSLRQDSDTHACDPHATTRSDVPGGHFPSTTQSGIPGDYFSESVKLDGPGSFYVRAESNQSSSVSDASPDVYASSDVRARGAPPVEAQVLQRGPDAQDTEDLYSAPSFPQHAATNAPEEIPQGTSVAGQPASMPGLDITGQPTAGGGPVSAPSSLGADHGAAQAKPQLTEEFLPNKTFNLPMPQMGTGETEELDPSQYEMYEEFQLQEQDFPS